MKISFNVLDRQYKMFQKEYEEAALKVLRSGWYILGPEVEKFENEFSNFINSKYTISLNSGLDALIIAIRALNIGKGDEVIVPANTYIASILGITENKATPILVEPDEFYNLDAKKIEQSITKKTKAILAVHLYGQAANMKRIKKICKKNKIYLIEDCAQSHGAKFNNKTTGSIGDVGCFSFYPTKNLGCFGDGGAITTNNKSLAKKIKIIRNYGSEKKYHNQIEGVNSRLDEIQASLLRVKINNYEKLKKERKNIALQYLSKIKNTHVELPKTRKGSSHVWHIFVIRTKDRNNFQKHLLDHGIQTIIHYPIPPHLSEAYKKLKHKKGSLPITEEYSNSIVSIPLYNGMTNDEISYVINNINNYKKNEL